MQASALLLALVYACRATPTPVEVDCQNPEPGNKWAAYKCAIDNGPSLQKGCSPKFTLASPDTAPKGMVVVFHGYTACPDSFDPMVESWLAADYHVIQFLTVGHGRVFEEDCAMPGNYCANGDRVEGLPVTRQAYIDFVAEANAIVAQEAESRSITRVTATGLSLGGPLATHAVSTGKGLYSQLLVMNPFYGVTVPQLDAQLLNCAGDVNACAASISKAVLAKMPAPVTNDTLALAPYLSWALQKQVDLTGSELTLGYAQLMGAVRWGLGVAAEHSDRLPATLRKALDQQDFGWGAGCEEQRKMGRAGICNFRLRNLLAVHSFGQYAMQQTGSVESSRPSQVQMVTVERDGAARNSLAMQAAANFMRKQPTGIAACMFEVVKGCMLDGNECGVPHSMLSRVEQTIPPPFQLYWEAGLLAQTTSFLDSGAEIGVPPTTTKARELCTQLDVASPPPALVLPVPRSLFLTLTTEAAKALTRKAELGVAQAVARATGINPDDVDFAISVLDVVFSPPASQDVNAGRRLREQSPEEATLVLDLPAAFSEEQAADLERAVATRTLLADGSSLKQADILSLEVAGRDVVIAGSISAGASASASFPSMLLLMAACACLL